MPLRATIGALGLAACGPASQAHPTPDPAVTPVESETTDARPQAHVWERADERRRMVARQLEGRDISDARVIEAMTRVPRHRFVPDDVSGRAYHDSPLPIGYGVTISQPYIVALMSQLAEIEPGDRVLDVGTGSGYQAAVLAELGAKVWGIEIIKPLAAAAAKRLSDLGYDDVVVRAGDGYAGWPDHAPYAAIIVAAAPGEVPEPLKVQLEIGGKLVLPVGDRPDNQYLMVVTRTRRGYRERAVVPVVFVPMTGEAAGR